MIITGLDLESTGLHTEKDRICEVALISYRYDPAAREHERLLTFTTRVNPGMKIHPEAQRVHGISNEDVADCKPFSTFAPSIRKILEKTDVLVAHNGGSFDFPMLYHEMTRAGSSLPDCEVVDTIDWRWATFNGKMPKLQELCEALGVTYEPEKAHAAEYDVLRMMDCYFEAIRLNFAKGAA